MKLKDCVGKRIEIGLVGKKADAFVKLLAVEPSGIWIEHADSKQSFRPFSQIRFVYPLK